MRTMTCLFLAALLFTACRDEKPALQEQPSAPRTAAPANSSTAPAPAGTAVVRRPDGSEVMTVAIQGDTVDLTLSGSTAKRVIRGEPRDSGKRKYSGDGGETQYEVKPGDGSDFKLRAPDGSLRWKVKIDAAKVRISDNEQNDKPFELKVREGDRVKVFGPGDRELGNVRFDRAASKITVEDAAGKTLYTIDAPSPSGAYGVLLLDAIPDVQRQILVAEILSRGR
jgi:hypothetical protein